MSEHQDRVDDLIGEFVRDLNFRGLRHDQTKLNDECGRCSPQYFKNGIDDMNLIDIIEMLCDLKELAGEQDFGEIIEHIKTKYGMSDQLSKIIQNTKQYLRW
jgi:hypothetical protein